MSELKGSLTAIAVYVFLVLWHAFFVGMVYDMLLVDYTGVTMTYGAWAGVSAVVLSLTTYIDTSESDRIAQDILLACGRPLVAWFGALFIYSLTLVF